jgi:hypothetical protein
MVCAGTRIAQAEHMNARLRLRRMPIAAPVPLLLLLAACCLLLALAVAEERLGVHRSGTMP